MPKPLCRSYVGSCRKHLSSTIIRKTKCDGNEVVSFETKDSKETEYLINSKKFLKACNFRFMLPTSELLTNMKK